MDGKLRRLTKQQRQDRIVAELRIGPSIRASEIAAKLGVHAETIRRDLKHLDSSGLLSRNYGGAAVAPLTFDPSLAERDRILVPETPSDQQMCRRAHQCRRRPDDRCRVHDHTFLPRARGLWQTPDDQHQRPRRCRRAGSRAPQNVVGRPKQVQPNDAGSYLPPRGSERTRRRPGAEWKAAQGPETSECRRLPRTPTTVTMRRGTHHSCRNRIAGLPTDFVGISILFADASQPPRLECAAVQVLAADWIQC